MSKKVAIFLFEKNHYSFLTEVLSRLPKDVEVDIYSNTYYKEKYKSISNLKVKKESIFMLLFNSWKYQSIIIDELNDIRLFALVLFGFNRNSVELVVHNLSSWFNPNWSWNIRNLVVCVYRFLIIKIFNKYIVVGSNLKDWLQKRAPKKEVRFIPFGFSLEEGNNLDGRAKKSDKLNIVIPGMVSRRRKYESIINLIKNLSLNTKVEFAILGRPHDEYGEEVIRVLQGYNNVKTFKAFIPESEFNAHMIQSDIILSDFDHEFITMFDQKEFYGVTKETGVAYLMLKYQKPAILPAKYIGMKELSSQRVSFNNQESLIQTVLDLIEDKSKIEKLKNNAVLNRATLVSKIDFFN